MGDGKAIKLLTSGDDGRLLYSKVIRGMINGYNSVSSGLHFHVQ